MTTCLQNGWQLKEQTIKENYFFFPRTIEPTNFMSFKTMRLLHIPPVFCLHSVFMCFTSISEQTTIISLHKNNRFFVTDMECLLRGTNWIYKCNSNWYQSLKAGRVAQSVYRLTTRWMIRDRIPAGTRFSARPHRPWDPPSLLYNEYWVFPGGKLRPGRAADHSPLSSAAIMEEYSYISTHPVGHTGPVTGSLYLFLLIFKGFLSTHNRFTIM